MKGLSARSWLLPVAAAALMMAPAFAEMHPEVKPGLEKMYRAAVKDEAKALADLAKATGAVSVARSNLVEGERIFGDGKAKLENQQNAYRLLSKRIGAATAAKEVNSEAKALAVIAEDWQSAEETMLRGTKQIKKANKDLAASEKRAAKAEERIAKARTTKSLAVVQPAAGQVGAEPTQLIGEAEFVDMEPTTN